jgi:hypothetical protein
MIVPKTSCPMMWAYASSPAGERCRFACCFSGTSDGTKIVAAIHDEGSQESSLRDVLHDALRVHAGIVPEINELHKGCSTGTENIVHMMTKEV